MTNHPDALAGDQLYDLEKDPRAQRNLAGKPQFKDTLQRMREKLTSELRRFPDRPYGEFVPGGNAVPGAEYDDVFEVLRKAAEDRRKEKKKARRPRART